ncbi:MAG: L-seryl-tRNA(Sec) selenium transferase [bacterium]|nr:L-seryl-tRNA(Sec) selenium transferase [bacterium]
MSVFRGVPAVHTLLEHPSVAPYESLVGRDALRRAIADELDRVRLHRVDEPLELIAQRVVERLDALATRALVRVINATGTLLHTNLGRSPLASAALAAASELGEGYTNLEYDLLAGERGSRYERASVALAELTGAQDAVVVNNCAAAVLLIVDTFARDAEVIVSRNQLVEIGGGFRLPDVLARSGATLVEVGSTNKVYLRDVETALSPRTALLMRSHRSNFSIEGFVHDVEGAELVALGKRAGVIVVEDLGSGALVDLREYGLPYERTVRDAVSDGIGLVAFSGDKLLGGPQAGIIVGARSLVARLRSNPLIRALRVDKVTLALLARTLHLHRARETRAEIPFYRMLGTSCEELRARGDAYAAAIPGARIVDTESFVGGGTLPHARIPSVGIAFSTPYPDALAEALRRARTPIVARVGDGAVLLDLRTVAPSEDRAVIAALERLEA